MADMLVKLYELKDNWGFMDSQEKLGITIRKPIGPEKQFLVDWVRSNFTDAWASETDIAMSNVPRTCFVAIKDGHVIGFACYDATALGFFGPIGVLESFRGRGTGRALLQACMLDMKLKGYGYAIIGSTELYKFYGHCLGATEIPDSSPGLYKTWVKRDE
ncbi:hypothetical protein ES703_30457 [subsurface metagenome]